MYTQTMLNVMNVQLVRRKIIHVQDDCNVWIFSVNKSCSNVDLSEGLIHNCWVLFFPAELLIHVVRFSLSLHIQKSGLFGNVISVKTILSNYHGHFNFAIKD